MRNFQERKHPQQLRKVNARLEAGGHSVPSVSLLISRLRNSCVPSSGTYLQYFSQSLSTAGPGTSSNGSGLSRSSVVPTGAAASTAATFTSAAFPTLSESRSFAADDPGCTATAATDVRDLSDSVASASL